MTSMTPAFRLFLMIAIASGTSSAADENPPAPDPSVETARAREFLTLAKEDAAEYEIHLRDNDRVLEGRAEPVLVWSNPVVGEVYGGVFLWTLNGRPELAASIYKWYSPHTHRTHEFQSLSTSGLTASRAGKQVWTVPEPGVEFHPVPGALRPAETAAGRLLQMRRLAGQFSAEITERDGVVRTLRLLTQPIYRYSGGGDEWNDGALFAYVLGTDPEVLLLLESRRDAEGNFVWQSAAARMNWLEMRVRRNGELVWDVKQLLSSEIYRGTNPYRKFQFKDPAAKN